MILPEMFSRLITSNLAAELFDFC